MTPAYSLEDIGRPCSNDDRESGDMPGVRSDGFREQDWVHAPLICTQFHGDRPGHQAHRSTVYSKQTGEIVYLGGVISANAKMSIGINRRINNAVWSRVRMYSSQLYD